MAMKYKYHMIKNFTTNGDLGIATKAITEIVETACKEVEGVILPESHSVLWQKDNVVCKFNAAGELLITINLSIKYGFNVEDVCRNLQEKIESVMMFTTEIKPLKTHFIVDGINKDK